MTRSFKFTASFVVLVVVVGGVYLYWINRPQNSIITSPSAKSEILPAATAVANSQPTQIQTQAFTHPSLGFSFEYPAGYNIGQFSDDNGQTVLIQQVGSDKSNLSVQVYAQPFDEPGPITVARIQKDLPKQLIQNPQNISVGGISGLLFNSQEDGIGQTQEAWFISEGQLYSVTAPASASDLLQSILSSWKFDQ